MNTPPLSWKAPLTLICLALGASLSLPTALGVQTQPGATPDESTSAPADPRIDAATGLAKLNWPRPRDFDHLHMKLSVDFPDMAQPRLTAVEELTVQPIGQDRSSIDLDCTGPAVREVTINGQPAGFSQTDSVLSISFSKPAQVGHTLTLKISYDADFPDNKGEGLTWLAPQDDNDSPTQTSPQIYSQGEAQSNSTWFPCHDFPNERLTTELLVTVEDGYEVLSNGTLLSKKPASEGRTTFHWKQDQPHANYLVALYVAKCAIFDLGGPTSARPGLPMPVYCPIGSEDSAKEAMANVPAMIAFFEHYFDEPFPFDKYAQACIRSFNGGMENSSATFLTARATRGARGAGDDLLSHELAHQWTGDLITCNSWEHIWLNEGWATFAEALWDEHAARLANDGKPDAEALAREAYEKAIIANVRSQRRSNRSTSPASPAMVSNRYSNPDAVFSKRDNAYAKGATILHMLRERLGHDTFDRGVRLYFDRFKFATAETADFRRIMEEVSGQGLEQFFEQWCYRPGIPRLSIDHAFNPATNALTITVHQTQKIDGHNPAYTLDLPIRIPLEGNTERWTTIHADREHTTTTLFLSSPPLDLEVDPNLTILASTTIHKPTALWQRQAREGSTLFARTDAADHLASDALALALSHAADSIQCLVQAATLQLDHLLTPPLAHAEAR